MLKSLKCSIIAIAAAGLTAGNLSAQDHTTQTAPSDAGKTSASAVTDTKSADFIKEAARGNDLEVALAEVGAKKAQNADLKSFCQQLQQDHLQANKQLQPLAQKYGVALEQPLKHGNERELTKFENESAGAKFDQDFATSMLRDHQKDIVKFQEAVTRLQADDVKQYAQDMLPKLREHFDHAVNVAKAVGVEESTISGFTKKLPAAVGGTGDTQETQQGAGSRDLQQNPGSKHLPEDTGSKDLNSTK